MSCNGLKNISVGFRGSRFGSTCGRNVFWLLLV